MVFCFLVCFSVNFSIKIVCTSSKSREAFTALLLLFRLGCYNTMLRIFVFVFFWNLLSWALSHIHTGTESKWVCLCDVTEHKVMNVLWIYIHLSLPVDGKNSWASGFNVEFSISCVVTSIFDNSPSWYSRCL